MLLAGAMAAAEFPASHVHTRRDQPGTLTVDEAGVSFQETTPKKPHQFRFGWSDIQRLDLAPSRIVITTYNDIGWQLGRDRKFVFHGSDFSPAYTTLHQKLPRRLIAGIALPTASAMAEIPAKRLIGRGGHEGTLRIAADRIVFQSSSPLGSRTWTLPEVENISSSDPMELTIASLGEDTRIQLKQPLPDAVYNQLWRKLNKTKAH